MDLGEPAGGTDRWFAEFSDGWRAAYRSLGTWTFSLPGMGFVFGQLLDGATKSLDGVVSPPYDVIA